MHIKGTSIWQEPEFGRGVDPGGGGGGGCPPPQ